MNIERVSEWLSQLEQGNLVTFGFCPRDRELTPAIIDAGPEGVYAECGNCGLSNAVHPDQHYPAYSVLGAMNQYHASMLAAKKLGTIEGQRTWLSEMLQEEYDAAARKMDDLIDKAQETANEKVILSALLLRSRGAALT